MESKKVIIVGASSGIGEQLAKDLAQQGHIVGITGRRKELLEEEKNYLKKLKNSLPIK